MYRLSNITIVDIDMILILLYSSTWWSIIEIQIRPYRGCNKLAHEKTLSDISEKEKFSDNYRINYHGTVPSRPHENKGLDQKSLFSDK